MSKQTTSSREEKSTQAPAERSCDVVISGGGLVGLTLAAALSGAGLSVEVVDAQEPRKVLSAPFDGRASAIAAGSRHILEGIGLWSLVADKAEAIEEIRVSDGRIERRASPFFLHYDSEELGLGPLGHIVENRDLRRGLHQLLSSRKTFRLHAPDLVVDSQRDANGARVILDSGVEIRAALVVAAEGRNSPLRRAAGIPVRTWQYRQHGLVCTLEHERPHHGVAHEHFLPSGPFAVLPLRDDDAGRHRSSLVWTERPELAERMMALAPKDFAWEVQRRFGDTLGQFSVEGPRWSYPLSLLHAQRYHDTRLALLGDAAHVIHPIAGQGFNLGLRDVAALAECIVDTRRLGLDIGADAVLERYERWRRFDNMMLAGITDGLNRLFSNDIPPVRLARDLGFAAVERTPGLKRFFMRHAMGLVGDLPRLTRGEPL
ncbi:UbiH/UbiF/VisC/COQ6 family ubiquinone biosynthesis hydroxylase [Fodinicurvata fenggangensis]|uniref:UbiH/UbiF/VisC/COQ6 family ubiquinone biosynthesis hydroxylase n=1 Tax=Fodinicurvata fenggangensis TaxID=1121830 RepID=UPI00068A8B5D|nr:UbiH/UbiF/VisC/COQ6 family ubiquinone biosynthesis hydroxylase [Fodinicurvata fenggangensis]